MGYPVYKLIRAVNRQYPNNGFIDYVDVREDMYKDQQNVIDEDLRDLINEAIHETYIDIARDEVYSFPTVPGQNQYVLPDDCDLRDIQEVTRTFGGGPRPFPPNGDNVDPGLVWQVDIKFDANGGTGSMPDITVNQGDTVVLPPCDFEPPVGGEFKYWEDEYGNHFYPGDEYTTWTIGEKVEYIFKAIWYEEEEDELKGLAFICLEEDIEGNTGTSIGNDQYMHDFPLRNASISGTGLSLDSDISSQKIIVGSGITHVKISAQVTFSNIDNTYTGSSERYLNVRVKNGSVVENIARTGTSVKNAKAGSFDVIVKPIVTDVVVPVTEGSQIYATITSLGEDTIVGRGNYETTLTIEALNL